MDKQTIELINALLDEAMRRHNVETDAALARAIGVSHMAIIRWRRGEVGNSTRVLLPLQRAIILEPEQAAA
jgi:DNA-binding XRE family transcriptional regulator